MDGGRGASVGGEAILAGGGEMGARMRALDWQATPLGPIEAWPRSLKTAVRIMLTCRQPMFIWWGDALVNLYNDAYRATLGVKHPAALGQPARTIWREIWSQVGPRAESAMRANEGTYDESLLLVMERAGYPEETYYTFSYSPVPDDEGGTGGIICACTEDTQRIIAERQLALLGELATCTAEARSVAGAAAMCAQRLGNNPRDLPFAAIYLADAAGERLTLAGTAGFAADHPAVPRSIDVGEAGAWPVAEVLATRRPVSVEDLGRRWADLPSGAWERPPRQALVVPIAGSGQAEAAGVLIAGLNPLRLADDGYRNFLDLVSSQIAASIGSARAYEEAQARAESLAELDRAKTAFFSNVSHEFRTPLTLMLGPLDDLSRLAGEALPRDAGELLAIARRNGQRLLRLVNTLLDFSRIEAGRVRATYRPADLAARTVELASAFRSAIEKAGMRLRVECPPLPEPVFVDLDMWEKIVLNLLSNAFKYTFQGEIAVTLHAQEDRCELCVRDTGIGVPPDELPLLFNRFHRVEGARGRSVEGSGIGLALVQELVRLHGGTVEVESTLGEGSRFRVTVPFGWSHLPTEQVSMGAPAASSGHGADPFVEEALRWLPEAGEETEAAVFDPPAEVLGGAPAHGATRETVLVADDNADLRDYLRRLLAPRYEVVTAGDGEHAQAVAAACLPDLVIADIMMPHLDGFGLLRRLREGPETASIPVLLLSARAGEEARVEGLAAGADDYLTKPFSARELLARVGGLLALQRARRDATASLRESEARFRNLADNAPVMVWVTDADGVCTYLSRSWYEFTGQRPETGLGKGWLEAVHPDDQARTWEAFTDASGQGVPFRLEYRIRRADGAWRWAIDAAGPHRADDGRFLGYIGSVIDITDRKEAEEALLEADRRKNEFLATLAHELRNPLAPIRHGLELMSRAADDPPAVERARAMMERQVRQMVRLIDDLLDVGRISRGKLALRREPVELASVVRDAVEAIRALADRAGHRLTVRLPSQPLVLDGDAARLTQVLANLLNNAIQYTEPGGQVTLAAERVGDEVAVQVIDTGIGIPPEMLTRVFDLFTQVSRSHERSHGGLGIGLSLVRRLVELHGGSVEAHSDGPGRGSRFVVRLPLVAASARATPVTPPEAAAGDEGLRVLVADDNSDAAQSLALLLEVMGHEVRTAADGAEAVAVAAEFAPNVVLLDIGMPRMDGYEACRRIRRLPGGDHIVLAALTGWGQAEDRRRSREAGFDHHLVKPVEPGALEALLAR